MSRRQRDKRKALEKKKKLRDKRRPKPRPAEHKLTELGDYTLFEHSHHVFRVEVPSDWEYEEEDKSSLCFFPPEDDLDVRFSVYIMPGGFDVEAMVAHPNMEKMVRALFEKMNAVNPRRDATIPHYAWRADRNQPNLGGHYWIVAACDIMLTISAYYPEDQQHVWEPVVERMLTTFRIARQTEALLNKALSHLLRKLEERFPEEKYEFKDFEMRGKDRTIPLHNLAANVKASPERWEEIADEFFDSVVAVTHSDQLGQEQLADVREEIFPFIRADSFGRGKDIEPHQQLARSEWLGNLMIAYVIRIPSGFRYITAFDLERWAIDRDELHDIALSNLRQADTNVAKPHFPSGVLPFVMVATGDNMESSRLLKPDLYEQFGESLGGPFIAAIPARDALILFPNNEKMRRDVQEMVRKDYESSAYPITDRLFLVTPDGVTFAEW